MYEFIIFWWLARNDHCGTKISRIALLLLYFTLRISVSMLKMNVVQDHMYVN